MKKKEPLLIRLLWGSEGKMDFLCTLLHKHLHSSSFLSPLLFFSGLHPVTLTPSMDIYFGAKSLNNYANACTAMHNTVWKWLGEKMDSLRTDGMSAKSHLSWMQDDIFRRRQNLREIRYVFHTKHYLLWWRSS